MATLFDPRSPVYIENLARITRYLIFAAAPHIRLIWQWIDCISKKQHWHIHAGGILLYARGVPLQNYRLGLSCCVYRLLCPTMKQDLNTLTTPKPLLQRETNLQNNLALLHTRVSGRVSDVRSGRESCCLHQLDADPCAGPAGRDFADFD